MDYAFRTHIGCQTITLFIDYGPIFKQFLSNPQEEIGGIKMHRFWDKLRTFQGMLFFITAPVKRHLVPVEFNHYIEIRHPAEELQIRQWENHFKNGDCPEDKIIELVERHPMHLHEIDHMARQATIASFLKGRDGLFTLGDIHEVIGRLKHKKETPTLFGKD